MRRFTLYWLLFACLTLVLGYPGLAVGAEPEDVTSPVSEVVVASESDLLRATPAAVERALLEAIEKSDLRPLQKLRFRAIINTGLRPKVKQEILDTVTSQLIASDAIVIIEDGAVSAAYFTQNWDQIIELILRFLPLLLELLKLFG